MIAYTARNNRVLIWMSLCFAGLFLLSTNSWANIDWKPLAKGLKYTVLTPKNINFWGKIYAFEIDPKRYRFQLALAKDHQSRVTSVRQFVLLHHALLGVNGGFFTPQLQPIGLRISNGQIRQRMKATSWWGVFYMLNSKPFIKSQRQFRHQRQIDFAIQGGPRLLINGKIPKLKPGAAERTAVCLTQQNHIILIATQRAPMSTKQLALLLRSSEKNGGLACRNALNLDGGSSTQLYARIGQFELNIPGFGPITDAVLVLPRAG